MEDIINPRVIVTLTLSEAATALNVTSKEVKKLIHKGLLPGFSVGRDTRLSKEAVDSYKQKSQQACSLA